MKVCEKVQSKMKTTYNEVADELVAEFSNPDDPRFCADQAYDEKNIRRRVYDALNVLMAMDIIAKEKKEIMWRGLPSTSEGNAARLHAELAAAQQGAAAFGAAEVLQERLKAAEEAAAAATRVSERNAACA